MKKYLKNLIGGAASVVDLMPVPRAVSLGMGIIGRSDSDAMEADWKAVGRDFSAAFGKAVADAEARETKPGSSRQPKK